MDNCPILKFNGGEDVAPHQAHKIYNPGTGTGYSCDAVIQMQNKYGVHADNCPWVGYIPATECKCK